ncbi:IclR family transcriptional regulator [Sphingomonas sp. H160509]|uniref:IclR family transcriptional regulator n=1 Tax=Sphingomonas sp. H160509 TaxID=2955313 RepID=UPI0021E84C39|nr:IclR family transcriptional regulator [Sphingomonas sp. H160509]MDD1449931.1 IclR family transcriptional regulator [Sphingomonas sp. H160509]
MRPVELAFQIVELLGQHQPAGVTELAKLAGIPKSTAQRALGALHKTGWIEPASDDRGRWTLSLRALIAAGRANSALETLRGIAIPVMDELRRYSEETVHLNFRFDRLLILIERLDGIKPVRYFFPYGAISTLHATASGRAVLARLNAEELDTYLDRPMRAITRKTIVDPVAFRAEIEATRARGYAITFGGNRPDVHAVGAAITDPTGRPIAAMTISAPSERLDDGMAAAYGPRLADGARRISLGLAA